MTVAVAQAVELVRFQPEIRRAAVVLEALQAAAGAAGVDVEMRAEYRGARPWLLLWGPGAPLRADIMRRHVAAGGHAIALDLAYWNRSTKVRLTIDAAHPQAWIRAGLLGGGSADPARLALDRPAISETAWRPLGRVIVAGIGQKARAQYGADAIDTWERARLAECRHRWPLREVVYRPKPTVPVVSVDQELAGASLVVTWHSNIAVDAIRLGIPAVCRDGAAAAVCPSEIPAIPTPLAPALRDRFLAGLAWFQWAPEEAVGCWRFLLELLA